MSTTLTNGLKLPDKGSVDWYADMQSNYAILDGAVGTVAEHTTQIAGKAPAVHTHTKSDITDFPAYGNAAGTICEGNDSRLSDARTPVAHTHLTADVTDLLNSDHTWTGNNTYSKTVAIERSTDAGNFLALRNSVAELGSTPASATPITIAYRDKNDENLGYMGVYYDTDGSNHFRLYVRNKYTSGAPSTTGSYDYAFFGLRLNADKSKEGILRASFRPYDNNTHDLGSSSYQWNNLYAKNYYYNGVAWGLDQVNEWSKINKFSVNVSPSDITGIDSNTMAFTALRSVIFFNTTGSSNRQSYGTFLYSGYTAGSKPDNYGQIQLLRSTDKKGETNNGLIPDTSFTMWRVAPHYLLMDFMDAVRVTNDGTENSLKPITNNATDLGTSTNKWKSLNGVNPGALSIFNPSATYDPIDIPITWDTSGSDWNTLNVSNVGDGWICITYNNCSEGNYILVRFGGTSGSGYPSLRFEAVKAINKYFIYALFPVAKAFGNIYLEMLIGSNANLIMHHYIPSYGTV